MASWRNEWSGWRSVILQGKRPREREMVVRIDTGFHGPGWSRVCDRRTGRAGFVNSSRIRNAYPKQRRRIGC